MRDGKWKKGFVFVIIGLFIWTSVLPNITATLTYERNNQILNEKSIKNITPNIFSKDSNKQTNSDYQFGDIWIGFSVTNALITLNNEPSEGAVYYTNRDWISSLYIDYDSTSGFEYKFDVNIQVFAGMSPGIIFFDRDYDFEYIGTDCPDNVNEEVTKTASEAGMKVVNIYLHIHVDIYEKVNDNWKYLKTVGDDESCECNIKLIDEIPTCFPAGTKIIMADGSYKNIEDIKPGNRILSYNISSGKSSAWTVSYIPLEPIKLVYEINNGLLRLSEEHPLYIKKANGKTGWGALIPNKSFVQLKGDGLPLELGDQLFTSNKEWIKVTNITYNCEPVQVYNIWSFSATQNFFANDILVFEEHGTWSSRVHWYFEIFLDRFPHAFPILRHLLGY